MVQHGRSPVVNKALRPGKSGQEITTTRIIPIPLEGLSARAPLPRLLNMARGCLHPLKRLLLNWCAKSLGEWEHFVVSSNINFIFSVFSDFLIFVFFLIFLFLCCCLIFYFCVFSVFLDLLFDFLMFSDFFCFSFFLFFVFLNLFFLSFFF